MLFLHRFRLEIYCYPTGEGNNHIPSGGSAGQFLKYSSSGTATWATPSYTTEEQVEDFIAAMITAGNNIALNYDDTALSLVNKGLEVEVEVVAVVATKLPVNCVEVNIPVLGL